MKFGVALLASAGLFVVAPAFGQDAGLIADAKAFGSREAVISPRLSPDGSSVMYLTPGPGPKTFAVISNLASGKTAVMTAADGNPELLRWCDYAAADRAVCLVTGAAERSGELLGFERLIAMNTDGKDPKLLGQPESEYDAGLRQFDASVLDWGKRVDGKLLMEREYVPEAGKIGSNIIRKKSGLGVDLIDTRSLRADHVEQPKDAASGYISDGRGNVRIMQVNETKSDGTLTGRIKYFYRTADSRDWKTLVDYADWQQQMQPLAVDADINALYVLKKTSGRYALYTIKLDGSGAEQLIASNPQVDIDDVVRIGNGLKVIGYTYAEESRHAEYFDPEFKALAASLSKALPNLPLVDFVDSSADGRKLLIYAGSDTDPGRYYLFDRDRKTLNEAMFERPDLQGRTLAEVRPVTVPAADGARIPAYLTLPPGKANAKGLPAVVLPHGGPSARDEWGFDWLPQFLAARGYAVIQPQYRGSAGYGQVWENVNGFVNWRTSMSDIAASTRWLASQGIADPKRIAIVGWSYGGYAALMEAETDASLYKAVVAVAPVTDLELLKQDSANFTSARMVEDFVGSGPHIVEGSPLRHAEKIEAPVLLAHGDMDRNVRFWHSQKMADALQDAGKKVEFLQYKGLNHQLDDSTARTDLLTHIGALLDRTIG
ncbi:MAG TPA: S9 family peptidase, partial [Sphingomicrobium sp.]|nr:S9 family peptidase [Sphingomicrobium sp.]